VPHRLSLATAFEGLAAVNVAQTLLSVLVKLGTVEKINERRPFLTTSVHAIVATRA
jgi:hypothetical protein